MASPLCSISRRLLRTSASVLCLLSLLLCLAACWLWLGSRGPDPFLATLARAGRTYEVRSRDGRLTVLRINGSRPGPEPQRLMVAGNVSYTVLSLGTPPPPPVKGGLAGVQVERGQLQALEGTVLASAYDLTLALPTPMQSQLILGGGDGRLTLQNPQAPTATLVADHIVYQSTASNIVPLPEPLTATRVTVPYRLIAGATALLPSLWLALTGRGVWHARRYARRRRTGRCAACGYDLRGTPAAGRCPECGRPTSPASVPDAAAPDHAVST